MSSGIHSIEENREEKKREEEKSKEYIYSQITEIYNLTCTKLPQVQKITEKRKKSIRLFLKEFDKEQFTDICSIANSNEFLTGNNDRGWKADFDFLMRTDKATAILEGKYSSNKNSGMDDFKKMWEEAKQDEQSGNNTSNNTFGW